MHRDAPAVGNDAEFAERVLHPPQLFAQRLLRAINLLRGDLILAQLDEGLDGDQVGETVCARRRNQALALPTLQSTLGEPELAANIRARIFLLRGHANILTGYPKEARFSYAFAPEFAICRASLRLYIEKYLKDRGVSAMIQTDGDASHATSGTARARHGQFEIHPEDVGACRVVHSGARQGRGADGRGCPVGVAVGCRSTRRRLRAA